MPYFDDTLDQNSLTAVLSQVALRLRSIIIQEISSSPEQYAEVLSQDSLPPDPSIQAIQELVSNIECGKDVSAQFPKIQRLIHNQDSRAEVFGSLALTADYSRFAAFLSARRRVETVLLAMAEKAKLTPGDSLALLAYLGENIKDIEKKVQANTSSGKDIAALLGKIDYTLNTQQQALAAKMAKTTPQNREIMRRVAHKLLKSANKADSDKA